LVFLWDFGTVLTVPLFSLFGYYGWYADEVNGTFGTHLNGFTMTDGIIESKRDTGEEDHSSPPKQ
jgi:hypothetical protein